MSEKLEKQIEKEIGHDGIQYLETFETSFMYFYCGRHWAGRLTKTGKVKKNSITICEN